MALRRFLVSLGIEFGPVVVFFAVATLEDFFSGVWALMAATTLSLLVSLSRDRRLPLFSLIASSFVLLSGAITLLTHDPFWIALEYTLYNSVFGIVMFIGYMRGTPALKPLFETMFDITDRGWMRLSLRWGIFFLVCGIGSELAWRLYSYEVWVWYRFIAAALMACFGFSQFFLARKERMPSASAWGLRV